MTDSPQQKELLDEGFTLTELVVTIVIIGIVMVVIAGAFVVILSTSPATEARSDDARSLLGLTTWLPADVASTSETGFSEVDNPTFCGTSVPGIGLLELDWSQGGQSYRSNYRYVENRIRRYACLVGGSMTEQNLTSDLEPIGGMPPVDITLFPNNPAPPHSGLQFDVTVIDPETNALRELLSIDAFTENVPSTIAPLPPDPTSPPPTTQPNQGPTAFDYTYQVYPDQDTDLFIKASDPNGDALSATIDSGPAWVTLIGPMKIRVSPTSANVGTTETVNVTVSDPEGETDTATITLEVVPTATPTTTTTTTTTVAPVPSCVASIQAVTPSSTSNKTNQGNPTDVGKLVDEVTVSVNNNGFCGPLVLTFDPDPQSAGPNEFLPFNNAQSVTFPANMLWRDSFGTPHPLELRVGNQGVTLATATLTVL